MKEIIIDALFDVLKLLPYLFITFLVLEIVEHKLSNKNKKILSKKQKFGPIIGGILGAVPQCGFSSMAAEFYASRIITMGTLIAIFLSTSDEMLPIMLSEHIDLLLVLKIIFFKVIVGIIVGLIVDLFFRKKINYDVIEEKCHDDNCHCKDNLLLASIKHTLKIGFFILIANLLISFIIYEVGEENLSHLLLQKNLLTYFISALVGLIPNCASSVIITELYLKEVISIGTLLSGLLTGSGIGILLLFKTNKNIRENLKILSIIYVVGVSIGFIVDLIFS